MMKSLVKKLILFVVVVTLLSGIYDAYAENIQTQGKEGHWIKYDFSYNVDSDNPELKSSMEERIKQNLSIWFGVDPDENIEWHKLEIKKIVGPTFTMEGSVKLEGQNERKVAIQKIDLTKNDHTPLIISTSSQVGDTVGRLTDFENIRVADVVQKKYGGESWDVFKSTIKDDVISYDYESSYIVTTYHDKKTGLLLEMKYEMSYVENSSEKVYGTYVINMIDSNLKVLDSTKINEGIPQWIKSTAGWWANDQVSDSDFIESIQWLISDDILKLPSNVSKSLPNSTNEGIPQWIKSTAGWWANDQVSDSDFIESIQWLISDDIIVISDTANLYPTPDPVDEILPEGWKTYSNESFGISINHPDDWLVTDDPAYLNDLKKAGAFPDNGIVAFSSPVLGNSDFFSDNMIIQKENFGNFPLTLKEYEDIHKKVIMLAFDGKVIDTRDVVNGENIIRVMTFTGKIDSMNVKGDLAVVVNKDSGFVITLNSLDNSYDLYAKIAQNMFESFKYE